MYKLNTISEVLLCSFISLTISSPATAQIIKYSYGDPDPALVVEEDLSDKSQALIIERAVLLEPDIKILSDETIQGLRSNYAKRLSDMREQLDMAFTRGWLSSSDYSDLLKWRSTVAAEEMLFRQSAGGILSLADLNRLERHVNGLAYTINQRIAQGSKLAASGAKQL
ncbi:MAG: hypothetical protein K2X27_14865 [Candidatus Obscuribacterales bacterium]|nr:hypothetical protein [Candidatus Obscuribacterales bacterium]